MPGAAEVGANGAEVAKTVGVAMVGFLIGMNEGAVNPVMATVVVAFLDLELVHPERVGGVGIVVVGIVAGEKESREGTIPIWRRQGGEPASAAATRDVNGTKLMRVVEL